MSVGEGEGGGGKKKKKEKHPELLNANLRKTSVRTHSNTKAHADVNALK